MEIEIKIQKGIGILVLIILLIGCDRKPDYTSVVAERMMRSETTPFVVRGVWQRNRTKWLYYAELKKDCYVQLWLPPDMCVIGDTIKFRDLLKKLEANYGQEKDK